MQEVASDFTQQALSAFLKRNPIVRDVHYFPEVGSTNHLAFQLAVHGAREGEIVVADAQTSGKGRLNRVWHSPRGSNLYVSAILRPRIEPATAPQITLMAGVAVAELLSRYCREGVSIKWPNDVLIGGKKACGILTEMKAAAGDVEFIVLGIGLNVNMDREDFDNSLQDIATSLKIETGKAQDRLEVISGLFGFIEKWYRVFLRTGFAGLRDAWLRYADILGKPIRVVNQDESQAGVVTGIDDDGAILMRHENGSIQRVISGDIHLLGRSHHAPGR
jgi:BirA family biotin operon repressor/biotin-[acetyl-CoA-carboxylase] ligase